jgi:putative glycerol-1-phosphate prenyltransferase
MTKDRMPETPYMAWRHAFKLDPDRMIGDEALEAVCMSGTDVVLVGGSSGVTYDNTVDLLARIRRYEVPCALELTDAAAAVPGFDWYLLPMVLNAGSAEWVVGRQAAAIAEYGAFLPWDTTFGEGYIILNGDSEAARLTGARAELEDAESAAYAKLADRLMRLPIVYVEYSGRFGDMRLVRSIRAALTQARLIYGGGIDTAARAALAAEAAHTVVVGNVVYDDLAEALATVDAVKNTLMPTP